MKIYVKYNTEVDGWRRNQLDLKLMYYELEDTTDGPFHFRWIQNLQVLGRIIKRGDPIFVLTDTKGLEKFDNVLWRNLAPNVDFIINSSKILFVEPGDDVYRPVVQNSLNKLANVGEPR